MAVFLRRCGWLTFHVSGIYASPINDSFGFTNSRGRCTRHMECSIGQPSRTSQRRYPNASQCSWPKQCDISYHDAPRWGGTRLCEEFYRGGFYLINSYFQYVDMSGSRGRNFHEQAYSESLESSYTPHDILNEFINVC